MIAMISRELMYKFHQMSSSIILLDGLFETSAVVGQWRLMLY